MSTRTPRQKFFALFSFVSVVLLLAVHPLQAETVTTTVSAGTEPLAVAVNPVTNKIYVANNSSNNVTVIDGATNSTSTINAGTAPRFVAVNPVTNKIYVANAGSNTVTVIDGATNSTTTVSVGTSPYAVAVNPVTNKIYVTNSGSNNVTVIDGATKRTITVSAGAQPELVAVNPLTNRIYVANFNSSNVTVIDGATNKSETTVGAGTEPYAVDVNPVTNKIYVSNWGSASVTVIDGATNSTTTVGAGTHPLAVAVNPVTNKIYVANGSDNVTVIDGATNSTTTVGVGSDPLSVTVNPVTNRIYVANFVSANVTVIDGATNSTSTVSTGSGGGPYAVAVNPVTNKIYVPNFYSNSVTVIDGATNSTATIPVVAFPEAVAVNPVSNKIYVVNDTSDEVTVIDGATNTTQTVSVGSESLAVAVNPVTNKIYVANCEHSCGSGGSGSITVIDGATNSTTAVYTYMPRDVAVNPVTNKIYAANFDTNEVTVIDGVTNSTTSVPVGTEPLHMAVNPVTNKIYVSNYGTADVTVIDGATNSTTTVSSVDSGLVVVNPVTNKIYVAGGTGLTVIDGATNSTTTVSAGTYESGIAVSPVTNKIYVSNRYSGTVTVIDGATNSTTTVSTGYSSYPYAVAVNPVTNKVYVTNNPGATVTVIDGATNSMTSVPAGGDGWGVAVNPVTNKIYVTNEYSKTVTVITEQQVQPSPLVTAIAPLTNNQTISSTPTFNFTATSSFSPYAPTPQAVRYQLDTWQIPWLPASGTAPNFSGTTPTLSLGTHILYAFATDGQDANSTGVAQQLIGSMAAYVFDVMQASTTTALNSDHNPSSPGESVTFAAYVTVTLPGSGTPTGTVTFFDGTTTMGIVALDGSGHAAYATSSLTVGSHSITASYSGDKNFLGSTSDVLTQVVKANTTTALTSAPNPSSLGQPVTFTAYVTVTPPGSGTPTGNVTFYDGSTAMGTVALDGTGHAAYATAALTIGSHSITASYSGDTNFLGSTSPVLTQQVNGAAVTLSPTALSFGNVVINTTSTAKTVTLTNSGSGVLSISSIAASGSFAISSKTCGATLVAGAKCTVKVTFTPTVLGALTGTLTFTDNAPDSPQTVPLSGTGVLPTTLMPATATYAAQAVGTTSAAKTFTLTNYQTVALTSIAISTTGDFAMSATTCTTSLAAKGKCTISVTFTPSATGTRTGTLSVSDSANNSPQTVTLSGAGILPAALTPASATYPAQVVGKTSPAKTFTLTNNQTVALTGIAISTTGDFAVSATTCTTSLSAKSKCMISVTFTPTQTGTRTGQLSVSDSASNSPQSSNLTGTGK